MGARAEAAPPEGVAVTGERPSPSLQQRLVALMAARLVLSLLSFGIGLALDLAGPEPTLMERGGFYGTVAFTFFATVVYGLLLPRIERPKRFAAINIATDIAFVSALVHFSGGASSAFAFLYVLVAMYGALLFEGRGAIVCAFLGALAYGAVLGAPLWSGGGSDAVPSLTIQWAVHAGAIALVAALASLLTAELQRTGAALQERTQDLRHLHKLHQSTVESLMSGLLTTDTQDRVTSFNPEAERITGLAQGEALERSVDEVLPGIRELAIEPAGDGRGSHSRARTAYRSARGEELHLGVAAYPLREGEAALGGHVVIFQDVTDVVEMEQDLRRSERLAAVGELSASIAHEIRNPLAAISGSVQILEGRLSGAVDVESRRLIAIVIREADRLNHLITDFLRFARPGPLHLEPLDLGEAVGELGEMFAGAGRQGVTLEAEVPPGTTVTADAAQLRQLLWNLILNAADAMPEGGAVRVSAAPSAPPPPQEAAPARRRADDEAKEAWVEVSVLDQGVGIAPDELERIFDPFFTTKANGTGLGLATVHRIVEEHGGSIRVESRIGGGTAIRVRLPGAQATA